MPVNLEVVDTHAPWAFESGRGRGGKAAGKGGRPVIDEDGGEPLCICYVSTDSCHCLIVIFTYACVVMFLFGGFEADAQGGFQTGYGYIYRGKFYLSNTLTIRLIEGRCFIERTQHIMLCLRTDLLVSCMINVSDHSIGFVFR